MSRLRPVLSPFLVLLAAFVLAGPLQAGTLHLYLSQWETDEAGDSDGVGAAVAFGLGRTFDLELRGARYDGLENERLSALGFDSSLEAIPLEVGLRLNLGRSFYVAGGGSYFLLDSDVGAVDDEAGFYGAAGLRLGRGRGLSFFVEGIYHQVEATVTVDAGTVDAGTVENLPDVTLRDPAEIGLDGLAVNAGLAWSW